MRGLADRYKERAPVGDYGKLTVYELLRVNALRCTHEGWNKARFRLKSRPRTRMFCSPPFPPYPCGSLQISRSEGFQALDPYESDALRDCYVAAKLCGGLR